jgi:hypothetical protein
VRELQPLKEIRRTPGEHEAISKVDIKNMMHPGTRLGCETESKGTSKKHALFRRDSFWTSKKHTLFRGDSWWSSIAKFEYFSRK